MTTEQKAKNYAYALDSKVHQCRATIENERSVGRHAEFKHIKVNGQPFFEAHELRALDGIGLVNDICYLSEINALDNKIREFYLKMTKQRDKQ